MRMAIADYLGEAGSAIDLLVDGIWSIRDELEQGARSVASTSVTGLPPELVAMSLLAEDDEEDEWIRLPPGSFATYFGPSQMDLHNNMVAAVLASQVGRYLSIGALSGALLQVVKQGMSVVHGKKKPEPPRGRHVESQALSDVVWEARNQSMHWEDDEIRPAVKECFEALAKDLDKPELLDYAKRNLAFRCRESARLARSVERKE